MAHWAKIDENNIVTQVTVGNNDQPDEGYQWLIDNIGGTWIQTSYNTKNNKHLLDGSPLRGNFAGVGYVYDAENDIFMPPKPFESWILDLETASWVAPIEKPADAWSLENVEGVHYKWDEETTSWVEVTEE